ncbi:squalene/phytoene synthase family protein [Oceanicola sp. S124]|uniref:squalene/phytoene synthase family protein n=1 Tax=Oceanicola sp. S124 TaxID=1042378 RepID=UPI00025579E5|nr:squalene/phytoene synthase family protein [Oceanicola sp. S124]
MTEFHWSDDLTACAELVERGDAARFRTTMAAPPEARLALFPLWAFNIEVSRAPWVTQEPMIAEMRLQWWRDALDEIRLGEGIRRHEVVTPLSARLTPEGAGLLDQLIEARRWDIWKEPFEDEAHFLRYLDATSGHLLRAGAGMLGAALPEVVAADAGFALGLAAWFRAIPALEGAGRMPLPDGRESAVAGLAAEGLTRAAAARRARREVPRALAPLFYGLPEAVAVLKLAQAQPGRVADGALETAPLAQRLGVLKASLGRW